MEGNLGKISKENYGKFYIMFFYSDFYFFAFILFCNWAVGEVYTAMNPELFLHFYQFVHSNYLSVPYVKNR